MRYKTTIYLKKLSSIQLLVPLVHSQKACLIYILSSIVNMTPGGIRGTCVASSMGDLLILPTLTSGQYTGRRIVILKTDCLSEAHGAYRRTICWASDRFFRLFLSRMVREDSELL